MSLVIMSKTGNWFKFKIKTFIYKRCILFSSENIWEINKRGIDTDIFTDIYVCYVARSINIKEFK